uniref:Uncharacterized protein n=1 Tax=Ascaris lumbricoides TaxID=6252 RepID=A0A9J2PER8_ASCLU
MQIRISVCNFIVVDGNQFIVGNAILMEMHSLLS